MTKLIICGKANMEKSVAEIKELLADADVEAVIFDTKFEKKADVLKATCPSVRLFLNISLEDSFQDILRISSESFGKHMPIHPYHGFMKMIVPLCFRERLCPASAIICPDKSPASGVRFCSLFLHAGSAYLYHELY